MVRKINVVCPLCNKFKRIKVPPEILDIDEGSLLKLPIKKGVVCEHEFLAVLDYHFSVRDYEVPNSRNDLKKYFDLIEKKKKEELMWDFNYF